MKCPRLAPMLLLALGVCTSAGPVYPMETARIVGGEESLPGEWPFMVALITPGQEPFPGQFCGGSLISARWVLTAAHCVLGKTPDDIDLIIGAHDLEVTSAAVFGNIVSIDLHPDFDEAAPFDSDLALLELQEAVDGPTLNLVDEASMGQLPMGTPFTVTGWGNRSSSGEDLSPLLQQVNVPLVDNGLCQDAYDEVSVTITDRMLCAGYESGGKDACNGDSGGPLMVNMGGAWQQAGVVSFGQGCALPDFYGVYTKVSNFHNWVRNRTEGVAIAPEHDFGALPSSAQQSFTFTLVNNNDSVPVTLSNVRIAGNDFSSFRIDGDECSELVLAPASECEIDVTVDADEAGSHEAILRVDTDLSNAGALESRLSALVLSAAAFQTALESPELDWFTGGNVDWDLEPNTNIAGGLSIRSGAISHGEESIAMSEVRGPGNLSFHWKVSSEDDFDLLEFYLDGQRHAFVGGEVDWTERSFTIPPGTHRVLWRYAKNATGSAGEDSAYLDQVTMTLSSSGEDTQPPAGTESGGGGGNDLWTLLVIALSSTRRSHGDRLTPCETR